MDNAALVADATEMICIRNLDDRSRFGNASLRPESWSLFQVVRGHVRRHNRPDGLEPECYHSSSEAKAVYLRSHGIPALAYIDDAWYGNQSSTFTCSDKEKWVFAGVPSRGNDCLEFGLV